MEKITLLYETTELTMQQIADQLGVHYSTVFRHVHRNYSKEEIRFRKHSTYSNSKKGELNPMAGVTGEGHHNYRGRIEDGKGYMMVLKPDWYTGRKGSRHVFEHHIVICEALGLTEIPAGWCVHHIDGNKKNNDILNLAFLSISAHVRLHQLERATTREKSRRD